MLDSNTPVIIRISLITLLCTAVCQQAPSAHPCQDHCRRHRDLRLRPGLQPQLVVSYVTLLVGFNITLIDVYM